MTAQLRLIGVHMSVSLDNPVGGVERRKKKAFVRVLSAFQRVHSRHKN